MVQEFDRCKELQNALYSPLNPYVKWGTYVSIVVIGLLILSSFHVYTTTQYTTTALYGNSVRSDNYSCLELALPDGNTEIFIGDEIYNIEDDGHSSFLGIAINTTQSIPHIITIQVDSNCVIKPQYSIVISHKISVGSIILSYVLK